MARATAPLNPTPPCPLATAKATPTAIPSGMLCKVTARTSRVVLLNEEESPSGCFSPRCRCGISRSIKRRKTPPRIKPPAAGIQPICPLASASSIAGMRRDHTDAAIMTPAANPKKTLCIFSCMSFFKKKTVAAPRAVIKNVNPVPPAAHFKASIYPTP